MASLMGAKVAVFDGRRHDEMAALIRRYQGDPLCAPVVREVAMDISQDLRQVITALESGTVGTSIFLTGSGVEALMASSELEGVRSILVQELSRTTIVARGPKPAAALARHGLRADIVIGKPYTSREILDTLCTLPVCGWEVLLVHYGERHTELAEQLRLMSAGLHELLPYRWELPENTAPVEDAIHAILSGKVDALAFNSQVQVKHLIRLADLKGYKMELIQAMRHRVVIAAVAPVCLQALHALGIQPTVVPEHPKMGHLIRALAEYMSTQTPKEQSHIRS